MSRRAILQNKAIKLRSSGLSYLEINQKLGVPKSTLSSWLKNMELSPLHKQRLYTKKVAILNLGSQSHHERRQREIEKLIGAARAEVCPLSRDTLKLLGAAIYWAEGAKSGGVKITNSDPALILFMVHWLQEIFGINPRSLRAWLNIYSQQNEGDIIHFWADLTGIPVENFGKSFIKPENKNYKKNTLYYGTIQVRVPKSTDLQYRIQGLVRGFTGVVNPKLDSTALRWQGIRQIERTINLINTPQFSSMPPV